MTVPIFAHFSAASFLIPTFTGIYYWKRLSKPLKVFVIFFVFTVLHEITTLVLGRMGIHNQFLSNYYQLVETQCFLYLYYSWTKNSKLRDILLYVGLFYMVFWLINKVYYENPAEFNDVIATVALFILIVTTIIVLRSVLQNTNALLTEQSMFWIGAGVLLYSSFTIILLTMSNTILEMGMTYFIVLWYINWGSTIVANLLFARSFLCKIF